MDDGGDGAQDVCGEMGFAEEQARQKAPEPSQKQAAVVADGAEDGVDGVAVWTLEVVSFEQTIDFHVAEHGLDAVSSAHLAADCGRDDAAGARPTEFVAEQVMRLQFRKDTGAQPDPVAQIFATAMVVLS